MDRRALKNFMTKRNTIWTLGLCMTGAIVLGGIAAVDSTRRDDAIQVESELNELAYLEEEIAEHPEEVNDTIGESLGEEEAEIGTTAEVSGAVAEESILNGADSLTDGTLLEEAADSQALTESAPEIQAADDSVISDTASDIQTSEEAEVISGSADGDAADVASDFVISEQALMDANISFTDENSLMWPSAGTILIDYSMDGSVYFPTLNQYKYNPALIIGSETGNQVLASAKGMVESVSIDEETGTTLVLNIGNGYKLTYGQLKELAVAEGDVVEEGALLGYVSEPTKYYSEEGSNLYFKMTQNEEAVDPVLYLEG